jgi:chromosome segregation ATPase
MSRNAMSLGRSLFGYRRKAVIKLIEDRDRMLRQAESRVRAAEAKVGELESELAYLKAQNSRLDQQLELLRLQMESIARPVQLPRPDVEAPPPAGLDTTFLAPETPAAVGTPSAAEEVALIDSEPPMKEHIAPAHGSVSSFVVEELTRIMGVAQEGAARIIDRAAASAREQMARSIEVWHGIQTEVSRLAAWRDAMEPAVGAVKSRLDGIRVQIEEIPERIKQALAPLADAMASIDESLNDLSSLCAALAPTGDTTTAASDHEERTSSEAPSSENVAGDGEVTVVPESHPVKLEEGSEEQLETAWHAAGWMRATVGF